MLPLVTVQPEALQVVANVNRGTTQKESFWVSYNDQQNPTVYGDIDVYRSNGTELRALGQLGARESGAHELTVSYQCKDWTVRFPKNEYRQLEAHFTAIDVSPEGELLILGDSSGGLQVVTAESAMLRRQLDGHVDHVSVAKFFPSGQAAVSAGIDMRIKIWSLANSSNPRTLEGHTGSPVDVAIIGRGRNVVSGAADGTVRLWEVGSGQSIHVFTVEAPVSAIALTDFNDSHSSSSSPLQDAPFEYGTDGKAVYAADRFQIYLFDLRSKQVQLQFPVSGTTALATDGNVVITGSAQGSVSCYDCRNLSALLHSFDKSPYEIKKILLHSNVITVISEDNVPVTMDLTSQRPVYLTAADPVNTGVANSLGVYLAGKHGLLKFY